MLNEGYKIKIVPVPLVKKLRYGYGSGSTTLQVTSSLGSQKSIV
jgi:hypothetical protein